MFLSQNQIDFYNENGYLLISDFWNDETIDILRNKINKIVNSLDFKKHKSIFNPKKDEQVRNTDDYFLTSSREIRYFWEAKAWDETKENLIYPPEVSINKIGHGLHDLDPDFEKVSYDPRVGQICRDLGMDIPLAVQSMYIFKQPHIGGEVIPHQDGAFLYTDPQTCIGFWWPLDKCIKSNGCLWAVPGSHRLGVHRRFRRRDEPNQGTEFVPLEPVEWDLSQAVPLEISQGTLVIIHSALVHYSEENKSDLQRHAYSIHVVDGKDGVTYPADNWLQRPVEYPFRSIPSESTVNL
eukprot:gene17866-23482_t